MKDLYEKTLAMLEESFKCTLIASPIDFKEGVKHLEEEDEVIKEFAKRNDYDQISLFAETKDKITHIAELDYNDDSIKRRPIKIFDLISSDTSINDLLDLMGQHSCLLVLDTNKIQMIITRSDLNRLPIRTYFHTIFDHFEHALMKTIINNFKNDEWMQLLDGGEAKNINRLYERDKKLRIDLSKMECTYLSDKIRILEKDENLSSKYGFNNILSEHSIISTDLCIFRNDLYHAKLLTGNRNINQICNIKKVVHRLIKELSKD